MARILIVDDEESMREYLEILLRKSGHEVLSVGCVSDAIELADSTEVDLVLSDLRIGRGSGLDVLKAFKLTQPKTEVVMITAYATMENAIEAMKLGAYDYVTKPFKNEELSILVRKALEKGHLLRENELLKIQLGSRNRIAGMIGQSPAMREVYSLVEKVAASKTTVLIVGESGVGKELVARAVHDKGPRASASFVPINCGAIPEGLVESELFGHVRGAFTGAMGEKVGLFKAANGGTIFLDEVGELTLPAQVKLLRAIQERCIRPVGGNKDIEVDVRLIAATNRDLIEEVKEGHFREDLYYRLNVIQIAVPPLRERKEDVVPLAEYFAARCASQEGRAKIVFSQEAIALLQAYDWPGNVRELENAIERAVTLTEGEVVLASGLPSPIRGVVAPVASDEVVLGANGIDLQSYLDGIERRFLQLALERSGGVKKEAAKLLGLTFRSMRYRLAKLGLVISQHEDGFS